MLMDAFDEVDRGVYIQFRTDGNVFNVRRFQARTKVLEMLIRDLLFADDCALLAHTLEDIQYITDRFSIASKRFGLTISIAKTEVLYQPAPGRDHYDPIVIIDNARLKSVKKFCYLGNVLSSNGQINDEIAQRLAKANSTFGRLSKRVWKDHGIRIGTKIQVYQATVIPTLIYGCETWTLYRRHIKQLDQFHMRCLRSICNIKWQDRKTNVEVLQICKIPGMESLVIRAQLRWAGHVSRMDNSRIPKTIFYSQLKQGARKLGRPLLRYKDNLKSTMKTCSIDTKFWEKTAADRTLWRRTCHKASIKFEQQRQKDLCDRRARRKASTPDTRVQINTFTCATCNRVCLSQIGLRAHQQTHERQSLNLVCQICNRTCKSKTGLALHVRTHNK